ncbi:hypothetical protein EYF80_062342 [Liparis tanakae]|uniref:Uncharacterized protein n=1 Tax=Liparis tanakae TaxID=230148 RepID=A0A4Z2EGB4_9TELE|nr:hypothetical protein EYF80_062342 [Liparis tanakae]
MSINMVPEQRGGRKDDWGVEDGSAGPCLLSGQSLVEEVSLWRLGALLTQGGAGGSQGAFPSATAVTIKPEGGHLNSTVSYSRLAT